MIVCRIDFAASITPALVRELARIDDGTLPVAEVARRLAVEAERLGETRPSYERVRQLVRDLRLERMDVGPGQIQLAFEVTAGLRSRPSYLRESAEADERRARKRERRRKRGAK